MAKIQLNGKKIAIKPNFSVLDLIKKFKLEGKRIAVEYNGTIIQRHRYNKKILKNNDRIEIVHFIGGG